jgi:hypothetical protein
VVKQLLKIVGIGLAVFILMAIAEEWDFFYGAWFGPDDEALVLADEDREAAGEAVYLMLTIMRHLYSSGGDTRFAERMPASDGIIEEIMSDIEYLSRNHRRQDPELKRMEIESVEPLAPDRVEVRTRELWSFRFSWIGRGGDSDPPRIEVIHSLYLVVRTQSGWRVEGWRFVDPPEVEESNAS